MGIKEKISNARTTTWLTEGISEEDVKATVELAKISAQIERQRLNLKMTQKEFADYMGVSQGMVSKWESREYNFTVNTLNNICERLGMYLSLNLETKRVAKEYSVIKWMDGNRKDPMSKKCWRNYINDKEAIA